MRMLLLLSALAIVIAGVTCRQPGIVSPLGSTYEQLARPAVWRTLPHGQAQVLGLEPGDVVLLYNNQPIATNDDLELAMASVPEGSAAIPLVILRGDQELTLTCQPGPLGFVPDAARYPSSLAVALEDILNHFNIIADYDWLAAVTGESFTFVADPNRCRGTWPGALAGGFLDAAVSNFGVKVTTIAEIDLTDTTAARTMRLRIRDELMRGKTLLARGGYPEHRRDYWGTIVRYDEDDSLPYGFTLESGVEVPLTEPVRGLFALERHSLLEPDPEEILAAALVQALELGQAWADSGQQSGIAAYDVLIASLEKIPFCPYCENSQDCFDKLIRSLIAGKESANRFLEDMKLAMPDLTEPIAAVVSDNAAIIGKLNGMEQSGIKLGNTENQRKLAMTINEIQLIEADLLPAYEDLIGEI